MERTFHLFQVPFDELGYLHIAQKQYDEAVETFNTAIVAHPDNFHDDSQDGEIEELIHMGRFDDALQAVRWMMEQVGD